MADQRQHDADALLDLMKVPPDVRARIVADIIENNWIVRIEEQRPRTPPPGSMGRRTFAIFDEVHTGSHARYPMTRP